MAFVEIKMRRYEFSLQNMALIIKLLGYNVSLQNIALVKIKMHRYVLLAKSLLTLRILTQCWVVIVLTF